MTGSAAAYAKPRQHSFAAAALDIGTAQFRPVLNRLEIEELFRIDAAKDGPHDPVWEAYFVENVVEFVVHGRRPSGTVSEIDAQWLIAQFSETPSPCIPHLLRALVAEAEHLPVSLVGYALSVGAMRV